MDQPAIVAVDDDFEALSAVERELGERYGRHYSVVCLQSPAEARTRLAGVRRSRRGRCAGAGCAVAVRHDRKSGARRGPADPPAREAGLVDRVGRLGPKPDRRSHLRGHRPRSLRPLRAAPDGLAGRALPPVDLQHAAGLGRGQPRCAVHGPHRRRVVVGSGLRAARSAPAVCDPAPLLPRRLGRRQRARRRGRQGSRAPDHGVPHRPGPGEPHQRRDRGRGRGSGQPGTHGVRPHRRRRRTCRPVGRGVRRLRRVEHPCRRPWRHRRSGDLQLAHPQLPRLPTRHQRTAARPAGVRPGLGLRCAVRLHADGRRHRTRGRSGCGHAVGRHPRPDHGRAPGDGRPVPAARGCVARGA